MNLRKELEAAFTAAMDKHPIWGKGHTDRKIALGNASDPATAAVIQSVVDAVMAYNNTMFDLLLRVADAVDDLEGEGGIEKDG